MEEKKKCTRLGCQKEYYEKDNVEGCCHSMINLREIGQLGTKRLADSLMTQTDAQHRLDARILLDDIH